MILPTLRRPWSRLATLLVVTALCFVGLPAKAQQGSGAQAVLRHADSLNLTEEQRSAIMAILRKMSANYKQLAREEGGKTGLKPKLDALRSNAREEVLALLTREQRKRWKEFGDSPPSSVPVSAEAQKQADAIAARSLLIPSIPEMKNPPSRNAYGPSAGITQTKPHPVSGENYVILTDHQDPAAMKALEKLAKHREGTVLQIDSLGTLHQTDKVGEFKDLRKKLLTLNPSHVAIAPRRESYRENMHLSMLNLLSGLDDDPELDVFPGYLVAGSPEGLEKLIDRTINFQPRPREELRPVSIGAIEDADSRRYRSYQKAKVIQKMFATEGIESPAIIITTRLSHTKRDDFPDLQGAAPAKGKNIAMTPSTERHTFEELSPKAREALNGNNLLFMFGHGTTERICGTRIPAFAEIDFSDELVFCGSCLSAKPLKSDRPDKRPSRNDGSEKRFAHHAVDNGAVMVLGHMGLCGGFPKVYPMSELVLDGLSTGEAYQRLMNALIAGKPIPDPYPLKPAAKSKPGGDPANQLLYVLWGDPALTPIQP